MKCLAFNTAELLDPEKKYSEYPPSGMVMSAAPFLRLGLGLQHQTLQLDSQANPSKIINDYKMASKTHGPLLSVLGYYY